jgi:hypothetical protein
MQLIIHLIAVFEEYATYITSRPYVSAWLVSRVAEYRQSYYV